MIDFSFKLIMAAANSGVLPVALIVASFNMLVNIGFSVMFGNNGIPKIRGYRGD